ncbi:MAG TPA: hypothetical protein VMW15_13465 [Terracidiphilus sp.]|nr:hypothetical protein [Terracidiphilus sp.]
MMRRGFVSLIVLLTTVAVYGAPLNGQPDWKAKVAATMPLLGHRNWILIVDSAYPLQSTPGVETIETNAGQIDVVQSVLGMINSSIHVRPDIYMDSELQFVPDEDAPGASAYRAQIAKVLRGYTVESVLHDKLIADVGGIGSQFHVLVLKTNMTIPYTSVFIRLDCKYWSADAEKRMRSRMSMKQPFDSR